MRFLSMAFALGKLGEFRSRENPEKGFQGRGEGHERSGNSRGRQRGLFLQMGRRPFNPHHPQPPINLLPFSSPSFTQRPPITPFLPPLHRRPSIHTMSEETEHVLAIPIARSSSSLHLPCTPAPLTGSSLADLSKHHLYACAAGRPRIRQAPGPPGAARRPLA